MQPNLTAEVNILKYVNINYNTFMPEHTILAKSSNRPPAFY